MLSAMRRPVVRLVGGLLLCSLSPARAEEPGPAVARTTGEEEVIESRVG